MLEEFKLRNRDIPLEESNQSDKKGIMNKLPGLFKNNATIKDAERTKQLKLGHQPISKRQDQYHYINRKQSEKH